MLVYKHENTTHPLLKWKHILLTRERYCEDGNIFSIIARYLKKKYYFEVNDTLAKNATSIINFSFTIYNPLTYSLKRCSSRCAVDSNSSKIEKFFWKFFLFMATDLGPVIVFVWSQLDGGKVEQKLFDVIFILTNITATSK